MNLLLKLLCVSMMSCRPSEALIESLYGTRDEFRVTTCLRRGVRCDGAVVKPDLIVVQNSCITPNVSNLQYVLLGNHNCTKELGVYDSRFEGVKDASMRTVRERFSHPLAPDVDLALLKLEWPFRFELYNRSLETDPSNTVSMWLEVIIHNITKNSLETKFLLPATYQKRTFHMRETPLKMFLLAVVLPIALFAAFFVFVTFYTGTTYSSNITYKTLNNERDSEDKEMNCA